jgi:hypothetical protein
MHASQRRQKSCATFQRLDTLGSSASQAENYSSVLPWSNHISQRLDDMFHTRRAPEQLHAPASTVGTGVPPQSQDLFVAKPGWQPRSPDCPWFSEKLTLACKDSFKAQLQRPLLPLYLYLQCHFLRLGSCSVLADQTYLS